MNLYFGCCQLSTCYRCTTQNYNETVSWLTHKNEKKKWIMHLIKYTNFMHFANNPLKIKTGKSQIKKSQKACVNLLIPLIKSHRSRMPFDWELVLCIQWKMDVMHSKCWHLLPLNRWRALYVARMLPPAIVSAVPMIMLAVLVMCL